MNRGPDPPWADPRLEVFREVREPDLVRRRGLFLVEGRRAVQALLETRPEGVEALLLTRRAREALGGALLGRLAPGVAVAVVARPLDLHAFTGVRFHQGFLAAARLPAPRPLRGAPEIAGPGPRLVVVLERVTDPDNVGAIARSALALGASALVLSPGCAHPLYRKAVRTSLGATLRLPWFEDPTWPGGLAALAQQGFVRVALTPAPHARDLRDLGPLPRAALLLGSEEGGLSAPALDRADERVRIPMRGGADSLNVAAAAAIALHHLGRRQAPDPNYRASDP